MDALRIIIGERIRAFRKMKKYSIEELAYQAGLNPAHLAKIERGTLNFTVGSLEKILIALDVSCQGFFQFETTIQNPDNPVIDKTASCMKNLGVREQKHVYQTAVLLCQSRDRRK